MKSLIYSLLSISVLFSCQQKDVKTDKKQEQAEIADGTSIRKVDTNDSVDYKGLKGTWVHHNEEGFSIIEIRDTADVTFEFFHDRTVNPKEYYTDKYVYGKEQLKMGFFDSTFIWIRFPTARFDYKIKGDSLVEVDKTGEHKIYIKVK
jgi:hypothetical protein